MERTLIVAATEKAQTVLTQFLSSCDIPIQPVTAHSCAEARRILTDSAFDLVLVNAPLPDEFGHEFAQTAAQNSIAGVMLLVKAEIAGAVAERIEEDGVFVLAKPLSKAVFLQAIHLIRVFRARLRGLQKENRRLLQRIEDIRLVDRAKCLLIECCAMTEPEAHTYIEQQAMNSRSTKRVVAESILQGGIPTKAE